MTNPPENPAGPPNNPNGPSGPPPGGQQQPPQGPPPQGQPQGPPPQGPPPGWQQGPPQGPPPGWQQPGPPPGWQPPHDQPVWQGHQAPPQSGYAWQQPPEPRKRTGLVIGIVVVALLVIGGAVAAIVAATSGDSGPETLAVSALEEGMCLTSDDLAQGNSEVDDMTETDCDKEHDAKVFAVLTVEEGESLADAGSRCAEELGDDFDTLRDKGIEVRPLAEDSEPQEDDEVVCFLRHEDGDPLDQDVV